MPRRHRLEVVDAAQAENALSVLAYFSKDLLNPEERRKLLDDARKASQRSRPVYELAFRRWQDSLPPGTVTRKIRTAGRFITGLGVASVLETGIRLHHIYGTPLIPGSGLKGLAAHYAHAVWGRHDANFQENNPHHQTLFGDQTAQGMLVFHDAWILPSELSGKGLVLDVMTPHHSRYNAGENAPPSDMDSPNPITFLSIAGHFLAAVTPLAPDPEQRWTNLTLKLLEAALKDWGAGGKTRAGYGRFSVA